ncbi:phosphoribosylaminoimidazolesuccinocarboxamide synthase [Brevibacillus laterosporus]|uniref:phosphoribosylaminoimidazolesuccinocarboxamide synthase n=1 Tax=Brevibacillus laterosporus TaxID=1465 RepID=UPI00264E80E4|nr:phosphoribosylaminoimidazolesuccinocarboxamide synthase [Brevibacillus laterosporus]MDN9010782.1 phosphoribosylaminoimidazolesuccinocarboxamide synthase [Brevibacillus laterosporus]MDO0941655.1 phosphoribosylaminoimidazolesuccinocarboxamide synthase [Brevibacillus laterosporus]
MEKREQLYEGKAKQVYLTSDPNVYWVVYKDDATAFNGEKKGTIVNKGRWNNQISAILFEALTEKGIANHFIRLLSETEQLVKKVDIIPLEVVVRNIAAGSLAKRLGWAEGVRLDEPVVEFYYKNDELGDPLINNDHIAILKIATAQELAVIKETALQVNEFLQEYMEARGVLVVDFKLEFGRTSDGEVLLADEISPDTCRFWDAETLEKLDKDRFRRNLGSVEEAYQEMLKRLGGEVHV